MKQNDWIIANVNNPDFTISDFQNIADMNSENTKLLKYEDYLNKDFIKNNESFKDANGNFNEDLFKQYYINKAQEFQQFHENDFLDQVEYSIWDVRRTAEDKVKNPNLQFVKVHNPDRVAMGIEGLNVMSDPTKTISEIAQTQKIWDTENNKFLDYSPNDNALFKEEGNIFKNMYNYVTSLFDDPLVIAKYDEDGTHLENGKEVSHKKGQYKLNEDGTYYTEKLNGRSVVGKEIISALDTITVDDSDINKYDFFDADGMDKSAVGTTIKNLTAAAPLYFLNPTGAAIYGGVFVARELAKALPMLADTVTLLGEDQDSQLLNTLAAYGNKFTGGTSQYAKQNMFSYENFANLATDVALQWGQQKTIANTIRNIAGAGQNKLKAAYAKAAKMYTDEAANMLNKGITGQMPLNEVQSYIGTSIGRLKDINTLLKTGGWEKTPLGAAALRKFVPEAEEFIAKKTRLGQDLSLAYMAIVSNTDVYDSVIQHGGTQKEAAAMALGSMIGMYSVDKFLGLGEMFFDDVDAQRAFRNAATKEADNILNTIGGEVAKTEAKDTTKKLTKWMRTGMEAGKKAINEYSKGMKDKTLGFVGKSFGEGLEEVSEELVADISKSLGELAGEFGIASGTDYGAWDNPLERYTMSFLGGAVGGAMFYGINGPSEKKTEQEMIYLIRNGKTNELMKELDSLHKKGKLASTTLSWKTSEGGNYISADENNESQNDYVYKRLKESIIQMDNIINENKLNLNEDQMFDKLVLSEARYTKLRDYLQDMSYVTGYQQEYQNMISELKRIDDNIAKIESGISDSKENTVPTQTLEELLAEKQQIIDKRNKFLNGEYSAHYLKKMLFAIDTGLSEPFISLTYDQYVRHNYGKDVKNLTEEENETYRKEWESYNTNSKKKSLSEAFRIYEEMEQEMIPIVEGINEQDVITWGKIADKLQKESPLNKILGWNDKLPSETEDDYKNRNEQIEGEDEESFKLRQSIRKDLINDYNNENLQKWYQDFIQGQGVIDQGTYRKLLGSLSQRKKDLYKNHKSQIYTLPTIAGEFDLTKNTKLNKEIFEILEGLKDDNVDEISNSVEKKINDTISREVANLYEKQRQVALISEQFKDGEVIENSEGEEIVYFEPITDKGPLTKQHIFNYYDKLLELYGIEDPEEIKEFLSKENDFPEYDIEGIFEDMISKYNRDQLVKEYLLYAFPPVNDLAAIDFGLGQGTITEEEANIQRANLTVDTSEEIEMTDEEFEKKVKETQKTLGKEYLKSIQENILKPIQQDPWIKTIKDFEQKLKTEANPVIQLLKVTNPRLGKNPGLEQQLEEIQEIWDNLDNPVDFELSSAQVEALKEAAQQLNYVKSFLYSASAIPNFVNPVGHNRALNEFAQKYSDKVGEWNPLPELSTEVSNVYLTEIDRYIQEADFWTKKAYENAVNKKEEFKQTDKALLKSRLDFYKSNKLELSDGTNLLEGWNDEEESLSNLINVDNIVYKNFRKAVKSGKKEEDILGELLEKVTKIDNIAQQITTPVNREITYAKYSDYDKFTHLVSVLASKDKDFYKKLKGYITSEPTTKDGNKIASLSVQEYAERVIDASLKNPNFINKALEVVNSKSTIKLPIIKNATLVTGVGGAGKTDVVVRASVSDIDPKDIWVSGPTQTQISGLQEVIKGAKGLTRKELMTQIIPEEDYTNLLQEIKKEHPNLKYFKGRNIENSDSGRVFDLVPSEVPFLDLSEKPKAIVIDEVTHFSGFELQLLGEWANKNNIGLIFVGDENQKGYEGTGLNVDREKVLMWRAPRLGVSLRDATYQKVKNLQQVINVLEDLRTSLNLSPEKLHDLYTNRIPNIEFKHYIDNDKFSGELITKDITPEIIKVLKGKVGYVGQEDDTYRYLKDQGVDVELFPPDQIQGREFDYVVINKKWETPKHDDRGINGYRFLQDLYTMMSRSKEGTVFIDNGLSDIIKSKQETVYARVTSVREAAKEFNAYKLQQLEGINFDEEESEELLEESSEETTKKTDTVTPKAEDSEKKSDSTETGLVKVEDTEENLKPEETSSEEEMEEESEEGLTEEEKNIKRIESKKKQLKLLESKPEVVAEEEPSPVKDSGQARLISIIEEDEDDQQEDLPEDLPVNPKSDSEEEQVQKDIRLEKSININYPVRTYGNIHLLGVENTVAKIKNKKVNIWENKNDSKQDIGLFLRPGEKVIEGKRKDELVKQLLDIKSVALFGTKYQAALNQTLKTRFTKDSFENMKYYIQVRDNDHLIGMTNLSQEKLKLNDKVMTIVGKLKDNTGEEYTITLGALADPATWKKNKNNILSAIKKRLEKEPSQELQDYMDNFDSIVLSYENRLSELSKKNQEIRIKKPNFTAMTELIFKDSDGKKLPNIRLEDINTDRKPWDELNPYAVVSDPHILIESIPGSNLPKGTTIRYVSANTLLDPNELENMYWKQKREGGIPQVRLQVLRNEGVSFRSLYATRYKDLYTRKMKNNILTFPVNLHYQSMNMYKSMWNFRSNLTRFNKAVNSWKLDNNLSNEDVDKLIKLDATEYLKVKKNLKVKHLSEEDYRKNAKNKDKLKLLWDFNDSLSDSVRQFRLGYSAQNGAYLRTLTNISVDNQFYKKYKKNDKLVGIYITPELANYYQSTLDSLFDKFLNKLVKKPFENSESYIEEYQKKWFNDLKQGGSKVRVKLYDINDNQEEDETTYTAGVIETSGANSLKALPVLLTEMAKYVQYYSNGKEAFNSFYNNEEDSETGEVIKGSFKIEVNGEEIDYRTIFDPDGNNIFETQDGAVDSIPGVHVFTTKSGAEQTMDFRINNLWDLMFHGSIENASNNDFTNVDWSATDAYFKNGISHEPIMFSRSKKDTNKDDKPSVVVVSSNKFFSTDTGMGYPIFYSNLEAISEEDAEEKNLKEKEIIVENTFQLTPEQVTEFQNLGLTNKELTEINNLEEALDLVNDKIKNNLDIYFNNANDPTPIDEIPVNAKLDEFGKIQITYITDMYPELKKDLLDQVWNNGLLTLNKNDNTFMTLQYIDNEFVIGETRQKAADNGTNTGQDVINILHGFIDEYKEAFKSPDPDIMSDEEIVEDYITTINNAFANLDLSRPLNKNDLDIALNIIDETLKIDTSLEDGLQNPYNIAISKIKNAIQELKQNVC